MVGIGNRSDEFTLLTLFLHVVTFADSWDIGVVFIAFVLSVYRVGYNRKFLKKVDILAGYTLDSAYSNIVHF